MPLIHDPDQVRSLYAQAAASSICLANFCTSNPYTTESILRSALEFARLHGVPPAPIIVSATGRYPTEPQLEAYTSTGDASLGMRSLVDDVRALVAPGSPFERVPVMLHLDHGQPGMDEDLFEGAIGTYATVMYDASGFAMPDNIRLTREFLTRVAGRVLVEGAVAEVAQASAHADLPLTTPESAQDFLEQTGVFLIVPDLGTEHRAAGGAVAQYDSGLARAMTARVGAKIVLHGSSSLKESDLPQLASDGIAKVNVWTIFERIGAQAVARFVLGELAGILEESELRELESEGWIGKAHFASGRSIGPTLEFLRESARRDVWQAAVTARMQQYLTHFGYARWTGDTL